MTRKPQCGLAAVCAGLLGGLLLAGCHPRGSGYPDPTPPPPQQLTAEQAALRAAIKKNRLPDGETDFAFRLLQKVYKVSPTENVFLSPFSVSQVVLLTANGTTGSTQQALLKSVGINGKDIAAINAEKREQLAMLEPQWEKTDGKEAPLYEWTAANAIWSKIKPRSSFVELCDHFYQAQSGPLTDADAINHWASEKTRGRIDEVVNANDVAEADMILTNAVYFKGRWEKPFERENTTKGLFHLGDGTTREQSLMHAPQETLPWYQGKNFEAVSLPYEGGMSMILSLPVRGSTAEQVLASLSADSWTAMNKGFTYTNIVLALPSFELKSGGALLPPLKEMGMPAEGNFSLIANDFEQTKITGIVQKTFLRVDERGTEAAAVTAMGMQTSAAFPGEPHPFVVDKPFLCAIVHHDTGTILFAGIINDPTPIP